ncbi:alpha/beta fold hydrolase [Quadrisphaera setariae]|uniref:Alpha/beta hydrolase n=1 Tax=Quadrisphaera setariae TaxID=2593304 RepID=A0A5C8Z7P5_9ACTN|nr:alpha/beta hydrolase [Quadrisphaera setariae]TXR52930.1 alpha/beta hydrolase [Quadrisphaera setariae]
MPRLTVGRSSSGSSAEVDLYYEDHGTGAPVVLIHGWPLSGRSWEAQVPALVEAGHRVITYDRRGFGDSSQPWDGYDYDTFAADLDALLTHLDVAGATLVGFSMGGGEVVRYISRYGTSRVAKAVLAAAVPPYLYKSADNPDGGLDDDTIAQFQTGVKTDRIAFLEDFTTNFFSAGKGLTGAKVKVSEPQRQYARHIAEFASPKGTLDCITAFGRTDFRGDVSAVAAAGIPVLVIHGDSDAIVPLEVSGQRSHEAIPGSQLHVVEDGPHGINASHAEEFNRVLLGFLAG